MPAYDFVCDKCGYRHEVHIRADWRDTVNLECPLDGTKLRRAISTPMAEIWGGKFSGRSLKKTDYDGGGADW